MGHSPLPTPRTMGHKLPFSSRGRELCGVSTCSPVGWGKHRGGSLHQEVLPVVATAWEVTAARGAVPRARGATGADGAARGQGTAGSGDGRDTSVPPRAPQCQAPAPVALPERWGQSQCHVVTALSTPLCCLLGQAVGTDVDDASTDFASGIEEEVARSAATQHVSWGVQHREEGPWGRASRCAPSPSASVPLEQPPGHQGEQGQREGDAGAAGRRGAAGAEGAAGGSRLLLRLPHQARAPRRGSGRVAVAPRGSSRPSRRRVLPGRRC